jgi:hypothetical protein
MKNQRFLIILAILASAALACNLGSRAGSATEAPSDSQSTSDGPGDGGDSGEPGQTDTAEPGGAGQEGGSGQAPDTIDLDDPALFAQPDLFNTYRTSMDYTFEADGPVTGTVLLDSATQVEPYATTLEFYTYGNAVSGGGTVYTFTQILETQYAVIGGFGCQSGVPGIQENAFNNMLDTGGMLRGEGQLSGEENVNGVDTYVYTVSMDNIDPLDTAGKDVRELENGLLYIAKDGGYVVRVVLEGRGVNVLLSNDPALEGDVYYELNFYDFDAPVSIEVPAGCAESTGDGSTYPIPGDATNVSQLGDTVLSFSTALTPDEAADFYVAEMEAHGCSTPTVVGDASSSISMAFDGCDFGLVSILIVAESDSSTLVSIFGTP